MNGDDDDDEDSGPVGVLLMEQNGLIWIGQGTLNAHAAAAFSDMLGNLPDFLSVHDKRGAAEQFAANYPFGGWNTSLTDRFRFTATLGEERLVFPGDPAMKPLAWTTLRDERILLFPHSWVVVVAPDDSFEVARLD
jgi:hypothetical protein